MKPFDLEKAKAGAKLVTRDGREVDELHHFEHATGNYSVESVIGGCIQSHTVDGKYYDDAKEHPLDLFLATVERTAYVNFEKPNTPFSAFHRSHHHATEEQARDMARTSGFQYLAVAVPVTFTE